MNNIMYSEKKSTRSFSQVGTNGQAAVKNECNCSFSAVIGWWCWQRTNRPWFVLVALKTRGVWKRTSRCRKRA